MTQKRIPKKKEEDLLYCLVREFYNAIDPKLRTYCSLGARVVHAALTHYGLPARLVPCQLVGFTATKYCVVGFSGTPASGLWDGHVVCATEQWIVDTAVFNLQVGAGFKVPRVVMARLMIRGMASSLLSMHALPSKTQLVWVAPQAGFDTTLPNDPQALVDELAAKLIEHLDRILRISSMFKRSQTAA